MTAARSEKKSETLEVRLGHATKTAFMARCRGDGVTASDAVRAFIDGQLAAGRSRRRTVSLGQCLAAAIAGLIMGVAAPSVAQTARHAPDFEQLDADHDGRLTPVEFAAR